MHEPVIAAALLIALAACCTVHCVVLVVVGRGCPDRRLEPAEIVMALSMAGMMAPAFDPLPPALWAALLTASVLRPTLLLAGRLCRRPRSAFAGPWSHYPHHVLSAAAMAALVLCTAPAHQHAGGGAVHGSVGSAVPAWTLLLLAAYFLGYAVRGAGSWLPRPAAGGAPLTGAGGPAALTSSGLVSARRTVMAVGMFYMLLAMS
ncbi:DUF5134 domain-containing protein [Kitasatospora sp. NPDC057692]|uniref:DUF5134 domain-containing protein n=1 Tax=Kitasatospora sp. NPDC057692 TaxID=3346215 RepID=UPI00367EE7C8